MRPAPPGLAGRVAALLSAAFLSGGLPVAAASADQPASDPTPDFSLPVPPREAELIGIFTDARRQISGLNDPQAIAEVRIRTQMRVANFMNQSLEAKDWVGIVRQTHSTPDNYLWVAVEIAPGVMLTTFQSKMRDGDLKTLIPSYSPLYAVLNRTAVGQPIQFSGEMLIQIIDDDASMIRQPQIVTRFSAAKPLAATSPDGEPTMARRSSSPE